MWTAKKTVSPTAASPEPGPREATLDERFERELLPFARTWQVGSFVGAGDARISYATFLQPEPRGALVIVPGRTEPALLYSEVVHDLRDTGFDFYLVDHRGQGFSDRLTADPQKSHVESFGDYVSDLHTFVQTVVQPARYERVVGLAHSMGGGIATRCAQLHPGDFTSLVLSAPMHGVNTGPYPVSLASLLAGGATAVGRGAEYAPGEKPPDPDAPFGSVQTTQSEARWRMTQRLMKLHPETAIGGSTYRWVKEALEASAAIRRDALLLGLPMLLFQSETDAFVDNAAQDEVCRAAARCEKRVLAGSWHTQLMERDVVRDVVLGGIREWLARPRPR